MLPSLYVAFVPLNPPTAYVPGPVATSPKPSVRPAPSLPATATMFGLLNTALNPAEADHAAPLIFALIEP